MLDHDTYEELPLAYTRRFNDFAHHLGHVLDMPAQISKLVLIVRVPNDREGEKMLVGIVSSDIDGELYGELMPMLEFEDASEQKL